MFYSPQTPPRELTDDLLERLNDQPSELLRHIAQYVEESAEYREREARLSEQDNDEGYEERPDDYPETVAD